MQLCPAVDPGVILCRYLASVFILFARMTNENRIPRIVHNGCWGVVPSVLEESKPSHMAEP